MPIPWKKIHRIGTIAVCVFLVAWLIGLLVRDGTFVGKFLFYIPTPVVFWSSAIWLVTIKERSRPAGLFIMAGMAMSLMNLINFYGVQQADPLSGTPRTLVQWNTMNMSFGTEKLQAKLLAQNPDIMVLNEPGSAGVAGRLAEALGPFSDHFVVSTLAVISRFPILEREEKLFTHARALRVKIQLPEGPVTVVGCNLSSNPLYNRGESLDEIYSWITTLEGAIVVTGDFNTPLNSVHFDSWRPELTSAWETCGRGWAYTWPQPLPCYAIDLSWYGPGVTGESVLLQRQALSDHKIQVFRFGLE